MAKQQIFNFTGIALIIGIVTAIMTSCTQEDVPIPTSENEALHNLYEELMNFTTSSVASNSPESRGSYDNQIHSRITTSELNYLSSLSQKEMELLRDSLLHSLGGEEWVDSLTSCNYARLYNTVGGHTGMDQLQDFSITYLTSTQGWDKLQNLMPSGISEEVQKIYVSQGAFIDQFARPVYEELITHIEMDNSMQIAVDNGCKFALAVRLVGAGFGMGVDFFLAAITDGGLAVFAVDAMYLELVGAWFDYEVCRGRWH